MESLAHYRTPQNLDFSRSLLSVRLCKEELAVFYPSFVKYLWELLSFYWSRAMDIWTEISDKLTSSSNRKKKILLDDSAITSDFRIDFSFFHFLIKKDIIT